MSYSPSLVANAFVYRGQQAGRKFGHLEIQKFVFFIHGWTLTFLGQSVVSERPEAWEHGPLFSSLYYRLRKFEAKAIEMLPEFQPETCQFVPLVPSKADTRFWFYVDQVLDRYGRFEPDHLSSIARHPGGAWEETRKAKRTVMSDEVIRKHFARNAANAAND
ncbi:Panacea domain-containing protein [Roseateles sp.]|uniref:Panacea domain-containing protein n=1 Tax=Roseateles sp. TaxID=1971397 RepID=UPI002F41133C